MIPESLRDQWNSWEYWLLHRQEQPMSRAARIARRQARIAYAVIRDLGSGILNLHAMSLVYTTLLSIVPLLALSFSVLKAMGVHNQLMPFLYQFFQPWAPRARKWRNR